MARRELLQLNPAGLERAFMDSGMKQWVLAHKLGVHPRTVSRWLQGRVCSIEPETALRLARALGQEDTGSIVSSAVAAPSTNAIREAAAKAITESDLLVLLSPSGNWALIEKLVLATLEPGLSAEQRGRLLNILSIACWRQRKFAAAERHARAALATADSSGNRAVRVKALFNLATLASFQGRYMQAISMFENCAGQRADFDTERDFGSTLANLAMSYRDAAMFPEALGSLAEATQIFTDLKAEFNLAVACAQNVLLLSELGRFKAALRFAEQGRRLGLKLSSAYTPPQMEINKADILAITGNAAEAAASVDSLRDWLAGPGRIEPELHLSAARVYRLAGDINKAEQMLAAAWPIARRSPLARGLWHLESARISVRKSDLSGEKRARSRANRVFRDAGLLLRLRGEPVAEHGSMFCQTG